ASGRRRPEYAALLAAQGEGVFSELLSLLAECDEDSPLFLVARKWQSPVLAQLLEERESPQAKHRTGAARAVRWLASARSPGGGRSRAGGCSVSPPSREPPAGD